MTNQSLFGSWSFSPFEVIQSETSGKNVDWHVLILEIPASMRNNQLEIFKQTFGSCALMGGHDLMVEALNDSKLIIPLNLRFLKTPSLFLSALTLPHLVLYISIDGRRHHRSDEEFRSEVGTDLARMQWPVSDNVLIAME